MIEFLKLHLQNMQSETFKKLAIGSAFVTGLTVALGAVGAHWFSHQPVSEKAIDIYNKATLYLLLHSMVVCIICMLKVKTNLAISPRPLLLMFLGALLFSVCVYLVAFSYMPQLGHFKVAGMIAPIGGILMIISWMDLSFALSKAL